MNELTNFRGGAHISDGRFSGFGRHNTQTHFIASRFLSSTVPGPILRGFLNTLTILICVCAPVALVTCFILIKYEVFQTFEWLHLDSEYWFGLEICVYVIFPLLLLTIFGTVNCCRVANSSRMLPTHQIQAIKINIGVTITTNMALFLFLVQVVYIVRLIHDHDFYWTMFRNPLLYGSDN